MEDIEQKFRNAVAEIRAKLQEAEDLALQHGIPVFHESGYPNVGPTNLGEQWEVVDSDVVGELTADPDWSESAGWAAS